MNSIDSITEFFYNIVPGILFILALEFLSGFSFINEMGMQCAIQHWEIQLFIMILLGLFLGFVFQGFTKLLIREGGLQLNKKWLWSEVKRDNPLIYKAAQKILENKLNNETKKELKRPKKVFYLMNNYLEGKIGRASLINHFSSRTAFWANIFWGTFFLIFIATRILAAPATPSD